MERNLPAKRSIDTRVTDILRDEKLLPMFRTAGLVHVSLGTEAEEQLKPGRFDKEATIAQNKMAIALLRAAGIVTEAQFFIGPQNETAETRAVFEQARPGGCLRLPPQPMVDELEVARLHAALREALGGRLAGQGARCARACTVTCRPATSTPPPSRRPMRTLVHREARAAAVACDARGDAERCFELRWQPQQPAPCRPT